MDVKSLTSDNFETLAFSVDAKTAQVFFRDRMYSADGKLRVIAQEYMTNARDAHREVGKSDTPIEISLPTNLNPEFVVRDYGMGISPDRVKQVLVIYGATTKDKNNYENGGFGLGAKCGFSYCNAFAVTTIHDGIKYVYSAYIDDNGLNQLALMYTGATEEPSGTEIKIPIRANDIYKFTQWVHEATHHWLPRPVFKGKEAQYRDTSTVECETGTGWALRGHREFSYIDDQPGIWILADDIPYRIPQDEANNCGEVVSKLSSALRDLSRIMVFNFKVGEIVIYPSREILYYNDKTKRSIAGRVTVAVQELVKTLQDKLDATSNIAEAVAIWFNASGSIQLASKLQHPLFKGTSLLKAYRPEEVGITVSHGKVELRGPHRCVKDFEAQDDVNFRYLFDPAHRRRRYVIAPSDAGELSLKDVKAVLRGDGDGAVSVISITNPELAKSFVDLDGFITAGFKPLKKLPKKPRAGRGEAEAVFMEQGHVSIYMNSYSSNDSKISKSFERKRVFYSEMPRRIFVDMREGEALDGTKSDVIDVEGLGTLPATVAFQTMLGLRVLTSGLRDNGSVISSMIVAKWAPRFAKQLDEDEITTATDWVEQLQFDIPGLDDAGMLRLVNLGYHFADFEPAKRWFWDKDVSGDNNASFRKLVDVLKASGRYSQRFLDLAKLYFQLEVSTDDDEPRDFVKIFTPLLDTALGDRVVAKAKAAVDLAHAVRDEFQFLFTSMPEMPYFLESLTRGSVDTDEQRGAEDLKFDKFISDRIAEKHTASMQFSFVNDIPAPAPLASEGTLTNG